MVRCEPDKYAELLVPLADLVDRHVQAVDAAAEAHAAILAALERLGRAGAAPYWLRVFPTW